MTKKEVLKIKEILKRIKLPHDGHVLEAIAICDKQIAIFQAAGDGIKPNYELDERPW